MKCHSCNAELGREPGDIGTGYGINIDRQKVCYQCCAAKDIGRMLLDGSTVMYLVEDGPKQYVTNWPGTLRIRVEWSKKGKHNIARTRDDVWFSYMGSNWHGVQYGENSLCYVKRTK